MASSSEISHKGTVTKIEGDVAFVEIQVSSACGSCKASALCGTSDTESRKVEAKINPNQNIEIGDEVKVTITRVMGSKAIILGYGLPFVVVVIGIFVLVGIGVNEGIAALCAIVLLVGYYFVLYLLRDKIKKEFNFRIEKTEI